MSEIFFTSDTHFCHSQPFLYEPRGFSSVEEMNETIIERWNKVIKSEDIVYHFGDTMLNNNEKGIECFKRLNGKIFLIFGNHDTDMRKNLLFSECSNKICGGWYAYLIKYNKGGDTMNEDIRKELNWNTREIINVVIGCIIFSKSPV